VARRRFQQIMPHRLRCMPLLIAPIT
jgi:hypothetical protein